jgi:hypothetical protein
MTIKPLACVALTAFLLGACAAGLVRLQSEVAPSTYSYSNFALYHAGRDTRVEVHGNPFSMDAAAFARAVTDHMQGANVGRPTHFTTTPGPSAERNMRVVMAFNSDADGYDLCNARFRPRGEVGVLTLKAAWCFAGREDSWVEATVGGAGSVNDPRFHDLVSQTVLNLFPTDMDYELLRDNGDRQRD